MVVLHALSRLHPRTAPIVSLSDGIDSSWTNELHELLPHLKRYAKGKHSKPPVSLHGQLLWREYFYLNGHAVPNFDRMEGNTICRFIPWGDDPDLLTAWKEGRTGYAVPHSDTYNTLSHTQRSCVYELVL